ncbi:serine/threonine-protein kinase [Acinetobacter baumannii]|uniref:serine/threonine-protein kinase n=1 Tax=Acinetobacter baumannii TaxID=470 RepID=UPI0038B6312C
MDGFAMSENEIEKYLLIEVIGHGAFGTVYRACDRALNAIKAVKILNANNPSMIMSQLEEAQILHRCKHKNIVTVNEANVYEKDSSPYIVIDMEYLPDGSLEKAIDNNSLSINCSIQVVIDVLFALEHAHFNGVLHRDIKPGNILLDGKKGKLSDFGLATILGNKSSGSSNGYITHLPSEFFKDKKTTELTVIFAMGMTLFRAINYIEKWDNLIDSFPNYIELVQTGKLASTIDYADFIPLKLKRIVNKAISSDPNFRYKTASEFRKALEKLKPNIDWRKTSATSFSGIKSMEEFQLELICSKHKFDVVVKRNSRRLNKDCRSFTTEDEANKYFYEYVKDSLFL